MPGRRAPTSATAGADTGDASKITYYTPRFSGFQLGVSYTPDTGNNLSSKISAGDADDLVHVVEAGVNYVEKFGDVDFRIHLVGGAGDTDADLNNTLEDGSGFMAGLGLGWMGWKLALGYGDAGDGLQTKTGGQDNGEWFSSGLQYSVDQYTFALGYFHGGADRANNQKETTNFTSAMAQYNMAPGLDVYGQVDYISVHNPASTVTTGSSPTLMETDNDGVVFTLGTRVTF